MVLFSLINVWFNKGGFEYTSVCIVTTTYYLLDVDFCSCSFWLYGHGMGVVWHGHGKAGWVGWVDGWMDGWDGWDGWDGMV